MHAFRKVSRSPRQARNHTTTVADPIHLHRTISSTPATRPRSSASTHRPRYLICGNQPFFFLSLLFPVTGAQSQIFRYPAPSQSHPEPHTPPIASSQQRLFLGSLDLAASKTPDLTCQSRSGHSSVNHSPRRPPLPLTPPLTPSSSLNESLHTPTDADASPSIGTRWSRPPAMYLKGHHDCQGYGEQHGVVSLDDPLGLELDLTPTEHSFTALGITDDRSPDGDLTSLFDSYLNCEAPPSRFLLVIVHHSTILTFV